METQDSFQSVVEALRAGEVAVFPTDTVYGVGVSVEHARAPQGIFKAKHRPEHKPVAWLVDGPGALDVYGSAVSPEVKALAEAYWPGALTIVVRASDAVPQTFTSAEHTLGLRMPNCQVTLDLMKALDSPLAASSANLSGEPAPGRACEVSREFLAGVSAWLPDDTHVASGIASTVVDCTEQVVRIVRAGAISAEEIRAYVTDVVDETQSSSPAVTAPRGASQDSVKVSTFAFTSSNARTRIHAQVWEPAGSAPFRGVVQLVHGMSEHIARYDRFAHALAQSGYLVCGHDHIGHGKSVSSLSDLGVLPVYADLVMEEDIACLRHEIEARYRVASLPWVLFGHSMGSYLVRAFLVDYREELAGVILCGTGMVSAPQALAGGAGARLVSCMRGSRYKSTFLNARGMGAFDAAFPQEKPLSWLNSDYELVKRYLDDPLCGQVFSSGGYAALAHLTGRTSRPDFPARAKQRPPVLFIAGDRDPVGQAGVGVHAAQALFEHAEFKTTLYLYAGMRHEILLEPRSEQVFNDVLAWLDDEIYKPTRRS